MIKNTAGQSIGSGMVSAATGAAFSGTVTIYITGDNGAQVIGSIGGGLCTDEGNGYFSYQPSQAETNYDFIAFTFVGTGAIPRTRELYTVVGATPTPTPTPPAPGTTLIADVFDCMGLIDNELDLTAGGPDEDRAVIAVKAAQRYFETLAAMLPAGTLQTTITVAAAAQTETTTWTATLKRLDAMWALDATTLRPIYQLHKIHAIGGHVPALPWPLQLSLPTGSGAPAGYYANTSNFYWMPLPDAAYSLRVYGFVTAAVPVDRDSAFAYPDECLMPFAAFAAGLMAIGVADSPTDLTALAETCFRPVLKGMRKFDRSEPTPRHYRYAHDT